MPLYEYKCKKCGHRFEKIVKFSDPPIKKCPVCKGSVEQLLSSPAIQFKGTGWYVTDYARKSGGKEESAAKAEEAKSGEQKADEKSDQKKKSSKESKESKESVSKEPSSKGAKDSKKAPA